VNMLPKVGLLGLAIGANFLRLNTTPSVPVGLYAVAFGQPHRGDYISLCLPDALAEEGAEKGYVPRFGPCPHFTEPLVKELAAVGGDVVDTAQWGRIRLAADQVFVRGAHPRSWDSRAFGPIPSSCLRGKLVPILTWKGH
jgi:type IV secretory pathway protease TraF